MPGRTLAATKFNTSFRRFLWTRLLGTTANQILMVALAWQIYDISGSAWDLGLVGLAQFVPAMLLTLPAGQLVDRVDRRGVLATSLVLQAVAAVVLTIGSMQGFVGRHVIFGMCVVMGVARALQMPAQQAIVPALVTVDELPRAFAASSTLLKFAVIGGPVLGGFLYAFGPAVAYASCLGFLVVSTAYVATIERVPLSGDASPVSVESLFAGFAFIWRKKQVLGAISLDLFAVLLGGAVALLPVFAREILRTGPWGLGLLRASPGAGAAAMAVLLAYRPLRRQVGKIMLLCVAGFGLFTIVFGLSQSLTLSMASLVLVGATDMVSVVIRGTLVQIATPDSVRGRVNAVEMIFIGASNEFGEFESGVTAQWLGLVPAVVLGGIGTLVIVGLWAWLFPGLRKTESLTPAESLEVSPSLG
jgi:MFS family permease